jgi:5'-deoxynucleotidase YfbR-like HD superfamily hydrolase
MSKNAWIDTYTGLRFYFLKPTLKSICIEDIAHSLSLICRFGGHVNRFYSVAQHSVFVSEICPEEIAFECLMHDATEAYYGDMVSPLKALMPEYQKLEDKLHGIINKKFKLHLDEVTWPYVKKCDIIALLTEKRDLKSKCKWKKKYSESPHSRKINPVSAEEAEQMFLKRFHELKR